MAGKMKIAIAKSLLEPVSIPWPEPYGHGKILEWIIDEIEESFQMLEEVRMLPSAGGAPYSIEEIRTHFKELAEMRGAVDVGVGCANLLRNTKWIGYIFVVHFREPGKKKQHAISYKTLF